MSYGNLISAAAPNAFLNQLREALTSRTALIIYACLILIFILVLTIRVMVNEQRRASELKERSKAISDVQEDEALKAVKKDINDRMDKISGDLSFVKSSLVTSAPYAMGYTYRGGKPVMQESDEKEEEVNEGGSRFYMLTQIDKEYESYDRPDYDDSITLKELCENSGTSRQGS